MSFLRCYETTAPGSAALVQHRYLAVLPHILIAVRHIVNVLVYSNGRVLVCCRIHLPLVRVVVDCGVVRGST